MVMQQQYLVVKYLPYAFVTHLLFQCIKRGIYFDRLSASMEIAVLLSICSGFATNPTNLAFQKGCLCVY